MKTQSIALLDLLESPGVQYVIPAYQRAYAWEERQCRELLFDLMRAAKSGDRHFIGTLLYADEPRDDAPCSRRAIIDGQQRLTTLVVLLTALARWLEKNDGEDGSHRAAEIRARYLHVTPATGKSPASGERPLDLSDKLVLSRNDRATLSAVVNDAATPEKPSERVLRNLAYFEERMTEPDFDIEAIWRGITALHVIGARAEGKDNAQLIFESLNSKGMPLTTADLVRNYLLLAESHAEQTRLYDEYWGPIEGMFAPDPGSLRLDNAIQGWLSVRFRKVRAKGAAEVYGVFKQYVEDEFEGTTESLLAELRNFSLVWAENYRYHAVKKYRSSFDWAVNGAKTLVSHLETQKASDQNYADKLRREFDEVDKSL